jgi:hypothetical protein
MFVGHYGVAFATKTADWFLSDRMVSRRVA